MEQPSQPVAPRAETPSEPVLPTGYKSPQALARVVRLLLLGHAILAIAAGISTVAEIELLSRIEGGAFTTAEVEANDARQLGLTLLYLALLLGSAIAVAVWMHRSFKNAAALGVASKEFGPHSWGWFFCPLLNLWKPYQAIRELFVRSGAADERTLATVFPAWWALWVTTHLAGQVETRMYESSSVDVMIAASVLGVVGLVAAGLAAVALRRIVAEIADAQDIAAAHAPEPHSPT